MEKEIAAFGGVQQRPTAITTARDKVQVVRSVVAVQAFGHCGTGLSARRYGLAVTELQSRLWESNPTHSQSTRMSGAPGNLSDIMQEEYVFFGGKRVVRWDVPTGHRHYYFSDHLGSSNVVTDNLGNVQDESDFYPYGGEIPVTNTYVNTYKFTGKERDSE